MILKRPSLNMLGALVSMSHLALKFPISEIEVGVVHTSQKKAQCCYNKCLKWKERGCETSTVHEIHML